MSIIEEIEQERQKAREEHELEETIRFHKLSQVHVVFTLLFLIFMYLGMGRIDLMTGEVEPYLIVSGWAWFIFAFILYLIDRKQVQEARKELKKRYPHREY